MARLLLQWIATHRPTQAAPASLSASMLTPRPTKEEDQTQGISTTSWFMKTTQGVAACSQGHRKIWIDNKYLVPLHQGLVQPHTIFRCPPT